MPRLKDLLEYLAQPGLEDIWLLLDIKVPWPALTEPLKKNRVDEWQKLDNKADDVMRLIASTIAEVKPSRPWKERVVLGCWAVSYFGNGKYGPEAKWCQFRPNTFLSVHTISPGSRSPTLDLVSHTHASF
jgi:hypothetical protein